MTTQQKIDALIEEQFMGYRGRMYQGIKHVHDALRSTVGDGIFLLVLEDCKRKNPRPIYQISEDIKTQLL